MPEHTAALYKLADNWEAQARKDARDSYPYAGVLDEAFFHAEFRYRDYVPYRDAGTFATRLHRWLDNVPGDDQKKALFKLLPRIIFLDASQMESLYRDAYRRIIVPWVTRMGFGRDDFLAADYEDRIARSLKQYKIFSITESGRPGELARVNSVAGLLKPVVIGEDRQDLQQVVPVGKQGLKGIIVVEDFVGTGKQASRVLECFAKYGPQEWDLLFVPLIILEDGLGRILKNPRVRRVKVEPVVTIPSAACIREDWVEGECKEYEEIRAVIKATARRTTETLNDLDDPPSNAFGYQGSGSLVVTCHNAPNNSLAMIHHQAPEWRPLFRRLHHSKDGL